MKQFFLVILFWILSNGLSAQITSEFLRGEWGLDSIVGKKISATEKKKRYVFTNDSLYYYSERRDIIGSYQLDNNGQVLLWTIKGVEKPLTFRLSYKHQDSIHLIDNANSSTGILARKTVAQSTVYPFEGTNDLYGLINENSDIVLQPKYDYIDDFSEGMAAVFNGNIIDDSVKHGFIDNTGQEVIPLIYDVAWNFNDGLAKVMKADKWGFIDKTGKIIIPIAYDLIDEYSEDLAAVVNGGMTGFIDRNNKVVIPLMYYGALYFTEGLCSVQTDKGWGFIDKNNTMVIPPIYAKTDVFSGGICAVLKKNKFGFIDRQGKVVIPFKYEYVGPCQEDRVAVNIGELWGYIDSKGNKITPIQYRIAMDFKDGKAFVELDDRTFYIDKDGKEIIRELETIF